MPTARSSSATRLLASARPRSRVGTNDFRDPPSHPIVPVQTRQGVLKDHADRRSAHPLQLTAGQLMEIAALEEHAA